MTFQLETEYQPKGDQPTAIEKLVEGLAHDVRHQALLGVTGSGKTFTMANVIERTQRPALIMAHNKTLAAQLYGEMKAFFPNNAVEYFVSYYDYYQPEAYVAASDTFIEKDASINTHVEQMRLSATKSLLERRDTIIVATVSAIYGLGDPDLYLSMVLPLTVGESTPRKEIFKRLANMQYERNDIDFSGGTYRVRGDVIDIFPAEQEDRSLRVSMFDDEIERIDMIDPLTGKVIEKLSRTTIYPTSHYVTPREIILETADAVKEELRQRIKQLQDEGRLLEAQRIEQRTRFDLEMMLELGYCSGIENYSRYLSRREAGQAPPTLIDYFPKDMVMFIDESHVTLPQLGAMYKGDRSRKENLVHYGFRLPSAVDNRPLTFEEFEQFPYQGIYVSATLGDYELDKAGEHVAEQVVRPTGLLDPVVEVRPVETQVDDVLAEVRGRTKLNERVLVTTLTKRMAEDLTDYLADHGVRVRYLHSDIDTVERVETIRDLRLGVFDVLVGINLLREGLDIPEVSLVAILDADKEGFLRSRRALIQTIGRAARHISGKAILYADRHTDAIKEAIAETERRRTKQVEHNEQHGISPASVKKSVRDVMAGARSTPDEESAKPAFPAGKMTPETFAKTLKQLDNEMRAAAKSLDFETAADLRDQIKALKAAQF